MHAGRDRRQRSESDASCVFASDRFACVPLAEELGYGEPCEALNVCMAGFFCANASAVPGCLGSAGCCTDFCDVTDGRASASCAGAPDVECVSFFEAPPEGFEHVGVCVDPAT